MKSNKNSHQSECGNGIVGLRKSFIAVAAYIAISMCLVGCFSMGGDFGSVIPQGQKAAIVAGVTTKTQILQELGNPDQRIDLGGGKEQFSYIKETVQTKAVFLSSDLKSSYTEFWVVFDSTGIVTDKGERPTTKQPSYFK